MSAVVQAPPPKSPPPADLFAIGWRDVSRRLPDGTVVWDRIPLTLEDALHPQEGDVILHNSLHNRNGRYLELVFEWQLRTEPTALVLADCKVQWDVPGLTYNSPDISVILGVQRHRDIWSVFDVAVEGVRPLLLVENVSPNTRGNDIVTKVRDYHRAGVQWYIIVDQEEDQGPLSLIGYQRAPRRYLHMPTDERGRLWLEPVRCWLAVEGLRVVCYDGETEAELGDYQAVSASLAEAQDRAEQEKQRAEQEKQRAERLATQLRALGIEPEA